MNLKASQSSGPPTKNLLAQTTEEETARTFRYEAIAELLREVRSNCGRRDNESMNFMLDAAYRICRACCSAGDEIEWHKQAYFKATQRQVELAQQLAVLIDLISSPAANLGDRQRSFPVDDAGGEAPVPKPLPVDLQRLLLCIKDLIASPAAGPDFFFEPGPSAAIAIENAFSRETRDMELPEPETEASVSRPTARDAPAGGKSPIPSLAVYFLSPFRVLVDEQPINGWPNCKGKSIFKYLVTHREYPIPKEVLMDIFWPDVDPDSARNNLNVAVYGLRKALTKFNTDYSYVLFQEGRYLLNPELDIWVDTEAFMEHVRKAKECERKAELPAAIQEYRAAEAIYQSEFLVEDRYEDWLIAARQNFHTTYLAVMNRLSNHYLDQQDHESCISICAKTLKHDACNEELHQRLMRCYAQLGHTHLALRQFHACREILARDLNLLPSKETMQLFEQIRQRQAV